jgi:formylglycine-generating enzyme required for sulfatase activity
MEYANRLGATMGLPPCYELEGCGWREVWRHDGAASFTIWSCERSRFAGLECPGLRLPTQTEAELAGRAGVPYCFATGPLVTPQTPVYSACYPGGAGTDMAWFCNNAVADPATLDPSIANEQSALAPQPVRKLLANPFGLYDAQGNVDEFTQNIACPARRALPSGGCLGSTPSEVEYDDVFIAKDVPFTTGGDYRVLGEAVCSSSRHGLCECYNSVLVQLLGLRLVRTALGDCDSLVLPPRTEPP